MVCVVVGSCWLPCVDAGCWLLSVLVAVGCCLLLPVVVCCCWVLPRVLSVGCDGCQLSPVVLRNVGYWLLLLLPNCRQYVWLLAVDVCCLVVVVCRGWWWCGVRLVAGGCRWLCVCALVGVVAGCGWPWWHVGCSCWYVVVGGCGMVGVVVGVIVRVVSVVVWLFVVVVVCCCFCCCCCWGLQLVL